MTIEDLRTCEVLCWREKRLKTRDSPAQAPEIAGRTLASTSSSTCSGEAVLHTPPSRSFSEHAADPRACPGCRLELPELDAPTPANVRALPACWALYGRLLVSDTAKCRLPVSTGSRSTLTRCSIRAPGAWPFLARSACT